MNAGPAQVTSALLGDLDAPMLVVTTAANGERAGCLVGFHTQCSIDPPRALVFLSDKNRTFRVAEVAGVLVVHVLRADQHALAERFGERTGDRVDKFADVAWHEGPGGAPILDDCPSWFAGRILEQVPGGDHVGFLLEPIEAQHTGHVEQLTLQDVKGMQPGHPA